MPQASILIVRRLADPARGTLLRDPDVTVAPVAWTNAARNRLDDLYRHAIRPADGPASPAAAAVVFRDAAELLACLARDFRAGGLHGRWWWEAWLRSTGGASLQVVIGAWAREAQWIPGALAALAATRDAVDFVAAIPVRDARHLFVAMAEAYEIPALSALTSPHAVPETLTTADRDESAEAPSQEEQPQATFAAPLSPDIAAPWARLLPSSAVPATLSLEQQTLLGVALALQRLPLVVRSRRFARGFHAWRWAETVRSTRTTPEVAALTKPVAGDVTNGPQVAGRSTVDGREPDAVRAPHDDAVQPVNTALDESSVQPRPLDAVARERGELPSTPVRRERVEVGFATTATAPDLPSTDVPEPVDDAGVDRPQTPEVRASGGTAELLALVDPRREPDAPEREVVAAFRRSHAASEVVTNLGGVLFLLNAFRNLELFERLDDHFVVTAPIGGWAWLEIVARGLIGRSDAAQDEGLWSALAALDDRPYGVPVTADTGPLRTLRLPDDWPPMRDGRRAVSGAAMLPLELDPSPRLRQLLDALVPYLRWRLLAAMGLDAVDPVEPRVLLLLRLLRRHGRLAFTATHVDLHMGLDQIDIAVRLAGLDANPGWVPALGRVVTFHFEG
jgi:hypothetical protein